MLGVLELVHARREDRVDHGRVRERDEPKRPLRVQLHPIYRPEALEVPPEPLLRRHLGHAAHEDAARLLVAPRERVVRPRAVVCRAQAVAALGARS